MLIVVGHPDMSGISTTMSYISGKRRTFCPTENVINKVKRREIANMIHTTV